MKKIFIDKNKDILQTILDKINQVIGCFFSVDNYQIFFKKGGHIPFIMAYFPSPFSKVKV